MLRSFHAELQKAHRRHDLLLCLLVPLIMILWVGGLAPSDPGELANGYSALLYSIPVIEAILMPVLMAVLASRLWAIEVKGSMPKLLYTLQERRSLFAGKAAFGLLEILLVTLLEMGAAVLLGIVHGYTEAFPTGQLVYLFVCTLAVDAMLFFGEFLLMLWVGNPLPALCVGIVGALVGLFSAFSALQARPERTAVLPGRSGHAPHCGKFQPAHHGRAEFADHRHRPLFP